METTAETFTEVFDKLPVVQLEKYTPRTDVDTDADKEYILSHLTTSASGNSYIFNIP